MAEYFLIETDTLKLRDRQPRQLDGPVPDLSHKSGNGLALVPVVRTQQPSDPNLLFRWEWQVTLTEVTQIWIPQQKTGEELIGAAFAEFVRRQNAFAPSQEEINSQILKILHLAVTGQMASITNGQKNAAKYMIDLYDAYKALKAQIQSGATPDVTDDIHWP